MNDEGPATVLLPADNSPYPPAVPTAASKPSGDRVKPPSPRWLRWIIVLGATVAAAGVTVLVASLMPSCTDSMAADYPAFSTAPSAEPDPSGCERLLRNMPTAPEAVAGEITEQAFPIASRHPERGLKELSGTLALAPSKGPVPGVVLIHGSGPSSRDGESPGGLVVHHAKYPIYRQVAQQLASWGLAVLRYDKRSCRSCYPDSTATAAAFRFHFFDDDVSDALDALAKHPRIDAQRLLIVGHSQGGQIAAFVASGRQDIAAVITLASQLDTMEDSLLKQFDNYAEVRLQQLDIIGWANLKWARSNYQKCFVRTRENFVPNEQCLGGGVTQQALLDTEKRGATTRDTFAALPMPLLMLQGNIDRNISPEDFSRLPSQLPSPRAQVTLLDGVGHSFVHLDDRDAARFAPSASRALHGFLRKLCRAPVGD